MDGANRFGAMMMAGGMVLALAACSRTSDGTIVMDRPVDLPGLNLAPRKPAMPSWLKFRSATPQHSAPNFPPPPAPKAPPKRKIEPPVLKTKSGKLDCKNQTEGGRVRMVCK